MEGLEEPLVPLLDLAEDTPVGPDERAEDSLPASEDPTPTSTTALSVRDGHSSALHTAPPPATYSVSLLNCTGRQVITPESVAPRSETLDIRGRSGEAPADIAQPRPAPERSSHIHPPPTRTLDRHSRLSTTVIGHGQSQKRLIGAGESRSASFTCVYRGTGPDYIAPRGRHGYAYTQISLRGLDGHLQTNAGQDS